MTDRQLSPLGLYRPLGQLALALQALFAFWIVFAGVLVVFAANDRSLILRASRVTDAEWAAAVDRAAAVNQLWAGAFVVTGIVFIVWFHRAYDNLEALGARMRHTPGWSIGGWFVPFAWLVIPKRAANDIWWGTAGGPGEQRRPFPALLTAWWLSTWIAVIAMRGAGAESYTREEVLDSFHRDLALETSTIAIAGSVLLLVAAVLALLVVRSISQREDRCVDAMRDARQIRDEREEIRLGRVLASASGMLSEDRDQLAAATSRRVVLELTEQGISVHDSTGFVLARFPWDRAGAYAIGDGSSVTIRLVGPWSPTVAVETSTAWERQHWTELLEAHSVRRADQGSPAGDAPHEEKP